LTLSIGAAAPRADGQMARMFDIPAGPAATSLGKFTLQSGQDLLYSADAVSGVTTNAVHGRFAAAEALDHLLAGTVLTAVKADRTGAIAVVRSGANRNESRSPVTPQPMKKPNHLARLLAALALSGGPLTAWAQTTPAQSSAAGSEVIVLPKFVITESPVNPYQSQQALSATRIAMSIQDVPQTLSVVPSEFIADSMSFKMSDAAKYVTPVVESTLPFGGDRYMIRGFQVSQEFIDGSVISGWSGYSMSIPQFNIDRIEVIKGPNSILFPGGSPGGVMNPITKAPMAMDASSSTLSLARYLGNEFSFDLNRVLNEKNHMAVRLVAGLWRNNNMYIKNMFRNGYEFSPSFSVELTPTQKLILKADFVQNRETNMGGLPIDPSIGSNQTAVIARGLPRNWSFGDKDDSRHRSTERMSAELLSTLGDHVTSRFYLMGDHVRRIDVGGTNDAIANTGGGSRNPSTGLYEPGVTWTTTNNADGTVTPVATAVAVTDPSLWYYTHNVTRVDLEYAEAHLKNDYAAKYETPWFKSTTLGGIAADFSKVHYKSWNAATTNFGAYSASRPAVANNPAGATIGGITYPGLSGITYPPYQFPAIVPADFSLATPTSVQSGGDIVSKQSTLNGFIFESVSAFNDHLLLSGGFSRFYGTLSRADSTNTSLNSTILLAAPTYNLCTNAKSIGIVIKPIKEVSLFASRNTTGGTMPGELAPGTYLENTTTFGPDAYHASATTVQRFRPTSGSQDEYGVKTSLLDGTLTGAFSYFKISQQNYGVPNSEYYTLVAQGRQAEANALENPIYLNLNAKGWEFETTYSLGKNLTILGNYTSFKERQPVTNVRVRAVPDHAGAVYLDYRFTDGVLKGFGANVGIDYKSDVAGENVNAYTTSKPITGGVGLVPQQPSFLVAGRTIVNVGFTYRRPSWTVRLQIANALDKDYILAAGSRTSAIVGEPRSWKISTTYNF
jgi:iron complex outermembrane receptor protein